MKRKRFDFVTVGVLLSLVLMVGCASFGKLKGRSGSEEKQGLEALKENWQDYDIYSHDGWRYCGVSVLFDPKQDDRTLISDGWYRIYDKETLLRLINTAQGQKHTRLYEIWGPGKTLYGYLLARHQCVYVKILDDGAFQVENLRWIPSGVLGP
jgi:hypothetical protein